MEQQKDSSTIIPKSLRNLENIKNLNDLNITYDLKQNKFVSILDSGILDSFKSIRISLQTASSLTYSILSIANIII